MLKLIVLTAFIVFKYNSAENILGIFHLPSKSHQILGTALMNALAVRGHQVTMISPFQVRNNKYEHIELTGMMNHVENTPIKKNLVNSNDMSFIGQLIAQHITVDMIDNFALNHTAFKTLASSNRNFDLVLINYFGNDAFLGISNKFNAATVLFSPLGSSMFTNRITGNVGPYSYVPNKFLPLTDKMNFWERLTNFVLSLMHYFYCEVTHASKQTYLLKKYFPDSPEIDQLKNNVSLILLNSHFSTETPRPHLPNMIQVGGLHIEETQELNEEYKSFMDSADYGVILFSLGSNIKISDFKPQTINAIISTFAKLRQKVLWKFETNLAFSNFPQNVKVSKWLPQNDILAHANLKVFVTHGGLLSITEAVYHGVPMVAVPIFGDQRANVLDAVNKGYAVKLDLAELTEDTFSAAIEEVLNNQRYREKVQSVSRIIKDQPIKPLDNAIYWIEYVMRHKGAPHLKAPALKLTWYQYYLLDVFSIFIAITVVMIAILHSLLRALKQKCLTVKHKNVK